MLPNLKIGNLTAKYPIIQGGMGVGISLSSLAGAVAKAGGIGVISAAQPGWRDPEFARDPLSARSPRPRLPHPPCQRNLKRRHHRRQYHVRSDPLRGIRPLLHRKRSDFIISSPPDRSAKIHKGKLHQARPYRFPSRTAKVLLKLWDNHYRRVPDLVVIEGPAAGGHLGYSAETVEETARRGYDDEIREILQIVHVYEEKYACTIPVVFAGGV